MTNNNNNYIIRVPKYISLNQIYWKRIYYPKLRRNWCQGSKLVFLTKSETSDEVLLGLGKIERIVELSDLEVAEKKICTDNNYYSKIIFGTMARFIPPLPVKDSGRESFSFSKISGPSLDGINISDSELTKIEHLANIVVIA